jgi:hypothetical protein
MYTKYKITIFIFIISSLLTSCFDPNKIPIAPFTHIPLSALWTKTVDRRINYLNNSSKLDYKDLLYKTDFLEYNYENLLNFKTRIYHGHATFNMKTKGVVYENYSNPFTLQIILEDIDENIIKFEIKKCNIICSQGEIKNILDMSSKNINIFPWWVSNDGNRGRSGDSTNINEILMERTEDERIKNYYIHFNDIPINYETDDEIIIYYEMNIYFKNEIKTYVFENQYKRVIDEMINFPPIKGNKVIDWHEITIDEYKKNI